MGFQYETTKRLRYCSICKKAIKKNTRIKVYKFNYEYIPRFYYSAVREKTFNICKQCEKNASKNLASVINNFINRMRQAGFRSGGYVRSLEQLPEDINNKRKASNVSTAITKKRNKTFKESARESFQSLLLALIIFAIFVLLMWLIPGEVWAFLIIIAIIYGIFKFIG